MEVNKVAKETKQKKKKGRSIQQLIGIKTFTLLEILDMTKLHTELVQLDPSFLRNMLIFVSR